jgi:hypothetical protein
MAKKKSSLGRMSGVMKSAALAAGASGAKSAGNQLDTAPRTKAGRKASLQMGKAPPTKTRKPSI